MNMEEIVTLSVKHNVSDLHLCNAWPARWRKQGRMENAPFTAPDVDRLLLDWLNDAQQYQWRTHGQLDFAVSLSGTRRLRASAFIHQQGTSLALRLLPERCPDLAEIQTPPIVPALLASENGLILVTGATGCGKSTTLAAMVGYLNQHADKHILTLEDPIEYRYTSKRCLIQQREIGQHCATFAAGLRAALREDPDVILLGELRDSETIRLALTAAETGHLVLATLHTRGAAQEKEPIRSQLAGSLRAVLSQKLEVDRQDGRVALFELLINTPATGNLIREGKLHQLAHVIQTGQQQGMMTFAQSAQWRQAQGRL
ncbi:type IV pilus twitching motility protein PilT [Salmonella enterica]|uniref:type IV pilus twitching motility protein PilT n=1 Tax=Salmonella enterica TaxID=28901 RepID=UPI000D56FC79|nr:type IV pilus twitching motility protein PilT [Salmonella enterica]EBP3437757.1 type IV pilus twitching motility protein PilT [Salmonella enterica subsp. enterica]EAN1324701.1 type IV pilus twitching motility protein PilT [Salmonella enterica]EAP5680427.1 type IV pilus twitching motility protein PilT [Salmonella enterica]EAU5400106.1 type IV pilus twitching motility protein PilT [Salmonella enterica]EAX6537803.1 type IV pilus twitching motility protein PilT [Salmonella enterica]